MRSDLSTPNFCPSSIMSQVNANQLDQTCFEVTHRMIYIFSEKILSRCLRYLQDKLQVIEQTKNEHFSSDRKCNFLNFYYATYCDDSNKIQLHRWKESRLLYKWSCQGTSQLCARTRINQVMSSQLGSTQFLFLKRILFPRLLQTRK